MIDHESDLTAAIRGVRPHGLDLDRAAAAIERRAYRPTTVAARRRGHRGFKLVAAVVVTGAAAFGGTQLVAAVRDEPRVTADGTELGQVSIAQLDPGTVWTVDVTQDGTDTCVLASAGSGSGGICAEHWTELEDYPQSSFGSAPADADGHPRLLVVIMSPPERRVGLVPRSYAAHPPERHPVDVTSMDGVHSEIVNLSGRPRRIVSFVLEGQIDDGTGPPVEAVYFDE